MKSKSIWIQIEAGCETLETLYSVLGVKENASTEKIKRAYKHKARLYHPDKVNNLGDKIKLVAELESKRLNKAKEVLLSTEKRKEYDEILSRDFKTKDVPGSSDMGFDEIASRTEEEYKTEIAALQTMIVGLNAENSNVRTELRNEKTFRTNLENQFTLLASDRFWMKKDLEMIINRFDEQIRIMDEQYRTAINHLINDLFMEIQFSEDEFIETQNRIAQIQGHNMRLLGDTLMQYNYFNEVRERLASLKEWRGVDQPPEIDTNTRPDFEAVNIDPNNMPDVEWDYEAESAARKAPENNQVKRPKKYKKVKRKRKDFIDVDYSSADYQTQPDKASVDVPTNDKRSSTYLSECPFCSKEVTRDQTYCYYCGAVF